MFETKQLIFISRRWHIFPFLCSDRHNSIMVYNGSHILKGQSNTMTTLNQKMYVVVMQKKYMLGSGPLWDFDRGEDFIFHFFSIFFQCIGAADSAHQTYPTIKNSAHETT